MTKRFLTALAVSGGLALAAPAAQALAMPIPAVLPAAPAVAVAPEAVLMAATTVAYPSVLPAPVAHVTPGVSKATVSWAAIAGAVVYEVRVVPAGGGATTRYDHVTSARSVTPALHSGRYVVNVRAGRSASDIHGHWSASRYFTVAAPAPVYSSAAARAVQFAYNHIGCRYTYSGTGPCSAGYDCSGLVQAAWKYAGVSIARTTWAQWGSLRHVSRSALTPGDLVFSNGFGHVMLYVGAGYVIQSPHTGAFVEKTALANIGAVGYARV